MTFERLVSDASSLVPGSHASERASSKGTASAGRVRGSSSSRSASGFCFVRSSLVLLVLTLFSCDGASAARGTVLVRASGGVEAREGIAAGAVT